MNFSKQIKKAGNSFLLAALVISTLFVTHEIKPIYGYGDPETIRSIFTRTGMERVVKQGIECFISHGTAQICTVIATIPLTIASNAIISKFFGPSKDKIIKHDASLLHLKAIKEKDQALQYTTQAIQLLAVQLQELEQNEAKKDTPQYKKLENQLIQMQALQKNLIEELGELTTQAALQTFESSNKKIEKSKQKLALVKKA